MAGAQRRATRQIHVGPVAVGGGAPITVQSMTITKTADVEGTLQQIYALAGAGCDIVRCTCNEPEAAEGLAHIVPRSPVPIIADIHHQYRMALAALEAGVHAFQTHPTELDHPELLKALATAGRPLLLGAVSGSEALVRAALEAAAPSVALLVGPAAVPSAPEELRLADLAALRDRHGVPVGLIDASDGASAFALVAPALAAAHGASFVEKRLALDRSRKGRDLAAALAPEEFYRSVELLRQAERARGDAPGHEAAARRRGSRGRSIVAASLIGRGDVLTKERLLFKRTDERFERGLSPAEADRIIGRRAARPIQADETIKEDMLE